eukprot:gene17548-42769_t
MWDAPDDEYGDQGRTECHVYGDGGPPSCNLPRYSETVTCAHATAHQCCCPSKRVTVGHARACAEHAPNAGAFIESRHAYGHAEQ